jgi:hypothetical protein
MRSGEKLRESCLGSEINNHVIRLGRSGVRHGTISLPMNLSLALSCITYRITTPIHPLLWSSVLVHSTLIPLRYPELGHLQYVL